MATRTVAEMSKPPVSAPQTGSDEHKVKGSSIVSKLAFVRERFGEEAEAALTKEMNAAGSALVLESSWYPFELYDRVLRHIAQHHFGGDLARLREVGVFSARHSLRGTYGVFGDIGEYERLLARLPALHGRFYNAGAMRSQVDPGEGHAVIELYDAPHYSEADLQVAAGFYQGAGEEMGCQDVTVDFEPVGDVIRFEIRWRVPSTE